MDSFFDATIEECLTKDTYKVTGFWDDETVTIVLIRENLVWTGQMTPLNSRYYFNQLEMDFAAYALEFRSIILKEKQREYTFKFVMDVLSWSKADSDIPSCLLGELLLKQVNDLDLVNTVLIPLVQRSLKIQQENIKLIKENREIKEECQALSENFKECNKQKAKLETTLYNKFMRFLENENSTALVITKGDAVTLSTGESSPKEPTPGTSKQ